MIREEWRRSPRGATKLYQSLAKQGVHIPKMQIYRFGRAQGWVVPNPRKQRKRRYVRYERVHSGSLLHGDFHRSNDRSPHCILWEDDASRMVLSGGEFDQATAEAAITTLTEALGRAEEWGVEVREVNTDRGCQFFANPREEQAVGRGQFERFLTSRGIRHVVSRVNHPQTNGKLERLWLEYDRHRGRFEGLKGFLAWYNGEVHGSLWVEKYETPGEAWQRKLPIDVQLGLFLRRAETEAVL